MPTTLQNLDLEKLTVDERLDLIGMIWESISETVEISPLTEVQKKEIDGRLAAHQANPQEAIPWEQVEADALARLQQ